MIGDPKPAFPVGRVQYLYMYPLSFDEFLAATGEDQARKYYHTIPYIVSYRHYVIPVEVKSGKTGTLRSLYQFMNRADHAFALRLYAGPIHRTKASIPDGKTYDLLILPYFLAGKLHDYLTWLINE
jgi:hypothetical protein